MDLREGCPKISLSTGGTTSVRSCRIRATEERQPPSKGGEHAHGGPRDIPKGKVEAKEELTVVAQVSNAKVVIIAPASIETRKFY